MGLGMACKKGLRDAFRPPYFRPIETFCSFYIIYTRENGQRYKWATEKYEIDM